MNGAGRSASLCMVAVPMTGALADEALALRFLRFRPDKDPKDCTWREVRPPRRPDDLTVLKLLAV